MARHSSSIGCTGPTAITNSSSGRLVFSQSAESRYITGGATINTYFYCYAPYMRYSAILIGATAPDDAAQTLLPYYDCTSAVRTNHNDSILTTTVICLCYAAVLSFSAQDANVATLPLLLSCQSAAYSLWSPFCCSALWLEKKALGAVNLSKHYIGLG